MTALTEEFQGIPNAGHELIALGSPVRAGLELYTR